MKRAFVIVTCAMLWVGAASAQTLEVRSGDHPEFSRITVPLAPGQTWRADRRGARIDITIDGHTGGFETDSVFTRMPRDRIAALETAKDTLSLTLACACAAATFVEGSLLVVDVAPEPVTLIGTTITGRNDTAGAPVFAEIARAPTSDAPARQVTALPWIGSGQPEFGTLRNQKLPPNSSESADRDAAELRSLSDRAALLQDMQDRLTTGFASAASVGLLEGNIVAPNVLGRGQEPKEAGRRTNELLEIKPGDMGLERNMRISNSMDMPISPDAPQSTAAGVSCPSDTFLPVETWGTTDSFAVQIGTARDALFNERDMLDPKAAQRLARLYIYFGFGAEALDALDLAEELQQRNPELVALATILERGNLPVPNVLGPYADCPSDIALWATLGFKKIPSGTLIDTKAALRALNKMPTHMRHFLAPALSARLLDYGDKAAAATALRSIERLLDPQTPQAALAEANLAIENGSDAQKMLEKVIDSNSAEAPEALVALVNKKLAADEPLSRETSDLVEAYVQELRGTDLGNEMRKLQALALSQSGQFEDAFTSLEYLLPALSPESARDMRETMLKQLANRADDLEFLDHMFRQNMDEVAKTSRDAKILIARRLMKLGFAAQVQTLLETVPDRPRVPERQLLAAEAAIQLQQPFQAQAALIGIGGPEAAMLMAQAKEMTGAYSEASALFSSTDAQEDAVRAAWLSDEWQALTPADSPTFGPVARIAGGGNTAPPSELAGPLGRANAALSESAAAREAINALLRDPALGFSGSAGGSALGE